MAEPERSRMENEAWRVKLSESLSELRKNSKLTQSELGEKLNYTDKSVSKWERGEGVPDVSVLVKLSDLYGVSIDEMLGRAKPADEPTTQTAAKGTALRKVAILLIMGGLMITLAFIAYFVISLAWPGFDRNWMAFIIALPCLFLGEGVWFMVWRRWAWAFGSLSCALWTACVTLNLGIPSIHANLLYSCGGIAQLIAIVTCCFLVLKKSSKQ